MAGQRHLGSQEKPLVPVRRDHEWMTDPRVGVVCADLVGVGGLLQPSPLAHQGSTSEPPWILIPYFSLTSTQHPGPPGWPREPER